VLFFVINTADIRFQVYIPEKEGFGFL